MHDSTSHRTARIRAARRAPILAIAAAQGGAVSRRQLYAAGLSRAEVRADLAAGRWQAVGRHVVVVHTGPLTKTASLWAAQLSGGPRAQLDGASALIAAGLEGFTVMRHRVSVPRGARTFRDQLVDVRQTRRWRADDRAYRAGVPRTRPATAAIRGALWATTDRQAALLLTMTVQQGIAAADDIAQELLRIRKAPRLGLITDVVGDLLGGVHSLGELDVARECRRRGLPGPSRQVVRQGRNKRYHLDACWDEWQVVVEIDGAHHSWAQHVVGDALRQNDVTLAHATVLRLPLLGLRIAADDLFAQIEQALRDAGWGGAAPAA